MTPENWTIIKINSETPHYRVFASWSGSYLGGASWRMNSGITEMKVNGDFYDFYGKSGSVYKCHKNCYGTHYYGQAVLDNMIKEAGEEGILIEVLTPDTDFASLDFTE